MHWVAGAAREEIKSSNEWAVVGTGLLVAFIICGALYWCMVSGVEGVRSVVSYFAHQRLP